MKSINVNKDMCIGCGACVAIDPEHFDFDEEGKSSVKSNETLDSETLTNAVESCPVGAISITEGEKDCNCGCHEGKECTCGDNCTCGDGCSCKQN